MLWKIIFLVWSVYVDAYFTLFSLCFAGQSFSIAQIQELCSNPEQSISNDQIHDIVVFLHQTNGLSEHADSFANIISLFKVKERPFHVPVTIQEDNAQPAARF